MKKIEELFSGWEETLIWSCLQGCMGRAAANDQENPTAARIDIGDFCFLAGEPDRELVKGISAPIIVPQHRGWEEVIQEVWGERVSHGLRYAIKKEVEAFDRAKLTAAAASLPEGYSLQLFDEECCGQASAEEWSRDLCSQFKDPEDYGRRGIGVAVMHEGRLVAGASSYTVYKGGIEIEIDTKQEHRQKGLAYACGARLILECLNRGLYPSWDAHDLRSVALAEKLGYRADKPYNVYFLEGDSSERLPQKDAKE